MEIQSAKAKLPSRQRMFLFINLLFAGLLIIIHIRLHQYAFDDAYIHFRVARNLIERGFPYFNEAQPLKVSTSSGWIVFLAILYGAIKTIHAEGNLPTLIGLTNALVSVSVSIVYVKIVELILKRQLSISQKIILETMIIALLLVSSIGLMETPSALLIAGLGVYYILHLKPYGITLLGLAIYFRLELFILAALVCFFCFIQKRFTFLQIIGYFIIGILPLIVFDLYYYHTVVPHSIIAKSTVYSLSPIAALSQILLKSTFGLFIIYGPIVMFEASLFIFVIIVMLWLIFRESAITRNSFWTILFYLSALLTIGVYIFGHSLLFEWYVPLYMLPLLVANFSYSYSLDHPKNRIIKTLLFLYFSLSFIFIIVAFYSSFYKPKDFVLFESGSRVKSYLAIGKIINEDYPDATLLTSEIGGLGYFFRGKILDAAGLASLDALTFHPMKVPEERHSDMFGAIPPGYVKWTNPDIIVSYDIFAEALLRNEISNQYNIIALPAYLPNDAIYSEKDTIWESKYLRIYIRKSLPVSVKICALSILSTETPNAACAGLDASLNSPYNDD